MVGDSDAKFYLEGTSKAYAPDIMRKVWRTAHQLGSRNFFIMQESKPITSDHYYINKITNIPTIDIIHQDPTSKTGFFKYWHTMNDNIDNIDPVILKAFGQAVLQLLWVRDVASAYCRLKTSIASS